MADYGAFDPNAVNQVQNFNQAVSSLSQNTSVLGRVFSTVAAPVTFFTKGLGGYANAAQAAQDRTLGLRAAAAISGQDITKLEGTITSLGRKFPVTSAAAAATVAQIQALGVQGQGSERKIGQLADTYTKLAGATGSSTQGITASLTNISRAFGDTNLDPARIGRFGDVITTLQAKFGGSAEGIASFTENIAPFARQAGIGESATLGIAAAFTKLGDDGGSAATAVNKVLADVNKSVRDGGGNLSTYADLVGKTTDQFRDLAKANPAKALSDVVNALGNGANGQRALESLGLDGVRTQRALSALSQGGGLDSAISTAVGAYGNGSTDKAATVAFSGLSNSLTKLQTAGDTVAETLGGPVIGSLTTFSGFLTKSAQLLGSFLNSGIGKVGVEIAGLAVPVLLFGRVLRTVGTGLAVGRAAFNSGPVLARRGGALIGQAGGDLFDARADALARSQLDGVEGRRGLRDLRAINQVGAIRAGSEGTTGIFGRAGAFLSRQSQEAAEERDRREAAARLSLRQADQRTFRSQGATQAQAEQQSREAEAARDAQPRIGRIRGTFAAGAQLLSAGAFQANSVYRLANAADPRDRVTVDNATGIYKGFTAELKNNVGAASGLTDKFKALRTTLGSTFTSTVDQRGSNRQIAQTVLRASASSTGYALVETGRAGLQGVRAISRGVSGALGGPVGLALTGATLLGGFVGSNRSSSGAATSAQVDAYSNGSITGTLDKYQDSIGKATGNTVTFGDAVSKISKAVDDHAKTISDARKVVASDIADAAVAKTPKIVDYQGTNSQIANQIQSSSLTGLGADTLQAIKVDLLRSVSADRASSILQQVDTTGKSNTTGNVTGGIATGTVSQPVIANAVAQGDGSSLSGVQNFFRGTDANTGTSLLSTLGLYSGSQITDQQRGVITGATGLVAQQYAAQSDQFGGAYAGQQRARNVEQTGTALLNANNGKGASDDEVREFARQFATQLGASAEEAKKLNVTFNDLVDHNGDLIDAIASQSAGVRTQVQLLANTGATGFSGALGRGLAATSQLSPDALAVRNSGVNAAYAQAFDNTRNGATQTAVAGALNQPDSVSAVDNGVQKLISSNLAAGQSLDDVVKSANAVVAAQNGTATTLGAFNKAVADAATKIQGVQAINQSPGAQFQVSARTALNDVNTQGTTDDAQNQRKKGLDEATALQSSLTQQLAARAQANQAEIIAQARGAQDFQRSASRQSSDYALQQQRSLTDYQTSRQRSITAFNLSLTRGEDDFQTQYLRGQRDFGIQLSRQAEDNAKAAYDPFKRIQAQATTDIRGLVENLKEQSDALNKQSANLDALRKGGITNSTIQRLGLADASNAQETQTLVDNIGQDPSSARALNRASNSEFAGAQRLGADSGNEALAREKADRNRQLSDSRADYLKQVTRARADQALSLSQQQADFDKQVARANVDFEKQAARALVDFQRQVEQQYADYLRGQKTFSGSVAQLQEVVNKGLSATQDDFTKITSNGLDDIIKLYTDKLGKLGVVIANYVKNGTISSTAQPGVQNENGGVGSTPYGPFAQVTPAVPYTAPGQVVPGVGVVLGPVAQHALGGIATRPHVGMIAEAGYPEAIVPLNQRGITMLAATMEKYLGASFRNMTTTGAARTYITHTETHHTDAGTRILGPVTVQANDPNELGHALAAKQRSQRLTASGVR